MTTVYPLIRHHRLDAVLGFREEGPASAQEFLNDAASLAVLLPARRHVINLCRDRYRFTVALAAALMRDQLSLMPPNDTPGVLRQFVTDYADLYFLHDGAMPDGAFPALAYPATLVPGPRPAPVPVIPAGQVAVVLFTSGSSGRPTPHPKSWGTLVRSALAAGKRLDVKKFAGAVVIGTVPQQHSYGLESTVLLALQHGFAFHAARPFYPGDIVASIAAAPRPRILITTPIHLRAMLADGAPVPPVDLIVSATAPLNPQLAVDAEARFHAPLLEIYGCSEAGQLAVRRTVESEEWDCLDGVRLRQDGSDIWASGASVEGDVMLSDVIELRGPRRFFLHGRTADLVNIAGKRTSIAHLNYCLNSIPGVADGVFVMPAETGEATTRLMAFVVAPGLTAESILAALGERIDAAFLPRPLLFVDALPRNLLGKLPREAILGLAVKRNA